MNRPNNGIAATGKIEAWPYLGPVPLRSGALAALSLIDGMTCATGKYFRCCLAADPLDRGSVCAPCTCSADQLIGKGRACFSCEQRVIANRISEQLETFQQLQAEVPA